MQQVGCILQVEIKMNPVAPYCEGAGERETRRKTEGERGRGGERVVWDQGGEAFSTWDCPRWTQAAPSLYKQPLASPSALLSVSLLFFSFNACWTQLCSLCAENMNKLTLCFFLFSSDNITPPSSNPCHFQSQHTTKCRADSLPLWVALFPIFSPPQPTHHLRRKEKTFCPENKKIK